MNSITPRRDFHDQEEYLDHIATCLASGHEPFAPATIAELHAALDQWPEYARRWLPPADECERLGIDHTLGLPIEPLTEREQERLLVTLAKDDDFRIAFRTVLNERGAA